MEGSYEACQAAKPSEGFGSSRLSGRRTANEDLSCGNVISGKVKEKFQDNPLSSIVNLANFSFISGIALMGASTETYLYGMQFAYIFLGIIAMGIAMYFIFLPVFQGLQITSVYEYLQMRFDRRIRLLGSVLFTVATVSMYWLCKFG